MIDIEKLRDGEELTLYVLVVNNVCQIFDFINSLQETDKKQVINTLKQRSDRFVIHNEQLFKYLDDGIFELKTRRGLRMLCFWNGKRSLVFTHGFHKCSNKLLKIEIEKAIKWRNEYQNTKSN